METAPQSFWQRYQTLLRWIVLPLVLGLLLAASIPTPSVGILRVEYAIDGYMAQDVLTQLEYVQDHPEIRAIVLVLDSPGGTVVDTETIYLELLKVRKTRPVVASINFMAASGAYYLTAGSDYAFARPTSEVGNIGVIGYLPPSPLIFEEIISTGPYKLWGSARDDYMRQIEAIKQGFYGAVQAGRGERLKAPAEEVLSGKLWLGAQALQMGLIDELGGLSDAVEKAAEMAHIGKNPPTVDLYEAAGLPSDPYLYDTFYATDESGNLLSHPKESGIYLLYVPEAQP